MLFLVFCGCMTLPTYARGALTSSSHHPTRLRRLWICDIGRLVRPNLGSSLKIFDCYLELKDSARNAKTKKPESTRRVSLASSPRALDRLERQDRPKATSKGGIDSEERNISLRRSHNASLLVSKLPPAIIVNILKLDREDLLPYPMCGSMGWVRLTHVFHYWRSVALAEPTLWADIPVRGRRFAQTREWLARSQQVVIRVNSAYDRQAEMQISNCILSRVSNLTAYNLVLEQMHRIQTLTVGLPEESLAKLQWGNCVAKHLEWLTVDVLGISDAEVFDIPFVEQLPPILNIPRPALLPNLAVLQLLNVRNRIWGLGIIPATLKQLTVCYAREFPPAACSWDDIYSDLARLHNIETITLEGYLRFDAHTEQQELAVTKTLRFPRLSVFHVEALAHDLSFLIARLQIPPSASLRLLCTGQYDIAGFNTEAHIMALSSAIANWSNCTKENSVFSPEPFRTCYLQLSDNIAAQVGCGDSIMLWHSTQSTLSGANLQVQLPRDLPTDVRNQFLSKLPLAGTEVLWLDGPSQRDFASITPFNQMERTIHWFFPSVRVVHLMSSDPTNFCAERFLPFILNMVSLREVHLWGLKFGLYMFPSPSGQTQTCGLAEVMERALKVREQYFDLGSAPVVLMVYLTQCYSVDLRIVNRLQGASDKVRILWDGYCLLVPQ
ncbi:hypothetical protein NM688_g7315 [Phlebia brevispora]|uniref:Uncharacterized protein n=1 Tax=Phlebia brevispora TaxID=194682 RepID=A0ACC1S6K8_9APHY|nr:hypothetical protein NM688_g7315 [Phlebia brevispora]